MIICVPYPKTLCKCLFTDCNGTSEQDILYCSNVPTGHPHTVAHKYNATIQCRGLPHHTACTYQHFLQKYIFCPLTHHLEFYRSYSVGAHMSDTKWPVRSLGHPPSHSLVSQQTLYKAIFVESSVAEPSLIWNIDLWQSAGKGTKSYFGTKFESKSAWTPPKFTQFQINRKQEML